MGFPAKAMDCEYLHDNNVERESSNMWSDIKSGKFASLSRKLNRNLMEEIDRKKSEEANLTKVRVGWAEFPINSIHMWDVDKNKWVPYDIWKAHFIANQRNMYVALRIYRPCKFQPEFGETIYGWHPLDSSCLNKTLRSIHYDDFRDLVRKEKEWYKEMWSFDEEDNK